MYRLFFIKLDQFTDRLRVKHYSRMFAYFGHRSRIFGRITVYFPSNIIFGENSTLNEGVILNAREKITIGKNCHISSRVVINTAYLDYSKRGVDRHHLASPVIIHDGVWIASGAIINPGVTIGESSVIGAGAVVTKDIPPNSVAVGIPARVVKEI